MRRFFWPVALPLMMVVMVLIAYEGAVSSFTHDEAYSYLSYAPNPTLRLLRYDDSFTNNHPLNSLLMKVSERVFGREEWALRLPNMLAGLAYLLFSALIARRFCRPALALPVFALLALQPLVLAFFSLARGYGLANALMMGSIYFHLLDLQRPKPIHTMLSIWGGGVAVLANFVMLWPLAGMLAVRLGTEVLRGSWRSKSGAWAAAWPVMAGLGPVIVLLYIPLRNFLSRSVVDFGGSNGFWEDTVGSLVLESVFFSKYSALAYPLVWGFLYSGLLACVFIWVMKLMRREVAITALSASAMLLMVVLVSISQHILLGTPYAQGRFAVFFIPLMVVAVGLAWDALAGRWPWAVCAPALFAIGFALHLFTVYDPQQHPEWAYDSHTKSAMLALKGHLAQRPQDEPARMSINWMYEPSTNYYRRLLDMKGLTATARDTINPDHEYFYVLASDTKGLPPCDTVYNSKNGPWLLARKMAVAPAP